MILRKQSLKDNDSYTCLFKRNKIPEGNIAEKIIPLKNRIDAQPNGNGRTFQFKVLRHMTVGTTFLVIKTNGKGPCEA